MSAGVGCTETSITPCTSVNLVLNDLNCSQNQWVTTCTKANHEIVMGIAYMSYINASITCPKNDIGMDMARKISVFV